MVAYAKGHGAVGWGEVASGSDYELLKEGSDGDFLKGVCLHRRTVKWKATAAGLSQAVSADFIRNEFGIYHPISTSVSINSDRGKRLIKHLSEVFGA